VDGEAALVARLRTESTAEGGDSFAHPEQPDAGHRGGVRRGLAVVIDPYDQGVGTVVDPDRRGP
jgi:hypothetical protein